VQVSHLRKADPPPPKKANANSSQHSTSCTAQHNTTQHNTATRRSYRRIKPHTASRQRSRTTQLLLRPPHFSSALLRCLAWMLGCLPAYKDTYRFSKPFEYCGEHTVRSFKNFMYPICTTFNLVVFWFFLCFFLFPPLGFHSFIHSFFFVKNKPLLGEK
jgi:hypothetical protein